MISGSVYSIYKGSEIRRVANYAEKRISNGK